MIYNAYKSKDCHCKSRWKTKLSTEMCVHRTSEIIIWYIRLAAGAHISSGSGTCAFFMGPHLALGNWSHTFPAKQNVSPPFSSEQSVWIFSLLFVRIFCRVIKKAHFPLLLMCSSFCHLCQVLLFSQGCFYRRISQDYCSSFLSSIICWSFPICSFRKRSDNFRN